MKHDVKNLEELRALAVRVLNIFAQKPQKGTATVIGLSGDLGAGKTAFTKCVASVLGITEVVTSPTFILEKVYIIPRGSIVGQRFTKLVHIDAYRLGGGHVSADGTWRDSAESDMRALDWEALLADENNLVFIEWPEHVKDALPKNMSTISFEYVNEGIRSVTTN